MRGRILFAALSFVLAVVLLSVAFTQAVAAEKPYKVGMTYIMTFPACNQINYGFMDGMAEQGFMEGEDIFYIIRTPEGDMTVQKSICDYFVRIKVDLAFPVSTRTAQTMVQAAKGIEMPIVFCGITDPVTAGLVPSWEKSAPYVTGVSDWCDVPTQIRFVKEIAPTAKRLGIIYNSGETNSNVQVGLAKEAAPEIGFEIVEATAATTTDVYAAANSLVGRADVIWIPTDNTAYTALDSITKVAEEHKIPFVISSLEELQDGKACAGMGVDYYSLGKQASVMVAKILKGEATAGDIRPERASMVAGVNLSEAKRMGITIPQAVIDKAKVVIE